MNEYYAIFEDFSVKRYEKMTEKLNNLFWLCKIPTYKSYKTSANNIYYIYKYEMYDSKVQKVNPSFGGWKIINMKDLDYKSTWAYTKFEICDPFGEVKEKEFGAMEEVAFAKALLYIKEMSKHANWFSLELEEEIEKWKNKYDRLLYEFKCLVEERKAFLFTDFFKSIYGLYQDFEKKENLDYKEKKEKMIAKCKELGLSEDFYDKWLRLKFSYDELSEKN